MTIEDIQKSTEFQTLIAECTAYDYKEFLEEAKPCAGRRDGTTGLYGEAW